MDPAAIVGAIGTLLGVVLIPFALKWRADAYASQADREGRERKAYTDGFASGCTSQGGNIATLKAETTRQQGVIRELVEENMECRELAAKQSAAINFLDQTRRQTHDELVTAGIRKGPFLEIPVDFRPKVADPVRFQEHQAELKDRMAAQIVERVQQEASKIIPPGAQP